MSRQIYDTIGRGYDAWRRSDPRIAGAIREALGTAERVVNVGAGGGSYEPTDRPVVAVEPSVAMLAQRPAGAAPAVHSTFTELADPGPGLARLAADLADGTWERHHGHLGARDRLDLGYRLVIAEW